MERHTADAFNRELKATLGEKTMRKQALSSLHSLKFPDADKLLSKIPKDFANVSTEELQVIL